MSVLALTYVEVDVPYCSLTYGEGACTARLGYVDGGLPGAIGFDGASSLERGAGLTGISDGQTLTASGWFFNDGTGGTEYLLSAVTTVGGATRRFAIFRHSDDRLYIQGWESAGSAILSIRSSVLLPGRWYHVLASLDLSNALKRHLYISDASDLASITYVNDNIDFTVADWGIGGLPSGASLLEGRLAEFWFSTGYIDFSVEANRRKFITADLRPVDLGANGETPTGTPPLIFLHFLKDEFDDTNLGTGGAFAEVGEPIEAGFATGIRKCFNGRGTCQDRANFDDDPVTHRFAVPSDHNPRETIDATESLLSVNHNPAVISLGEDLGTRDSVSVSIKDHPHSDTGPGFDKYLAERDYNPYEQGTWAGKFRARNPFLRGYALRVIRGKVGQTLEEMETRHFIIDSIQGPTSDLVFTIVAKDLLKFADGDRAQAPVLSNGFLNASIDDNDLSLTLSPTGIGDFEYPTGAPDYYVNIAGKEIVKVTARSGDVLTIVRAQKNTTAVAHAAQDRVQLCLEYAALAPEEIIEDLFVNYSGMDASCVPSESWAAETAANLGQVYTLFIAEPTSVAKLVSELIEVGALYQWWDNIARLIRLRVLGAVGTEAAVIDESTIIEGSLDVSDQPNLRKSQVYVFFAQINPLEKSDEKNFRSSVLMGDLTSETDYGSPSIKKIYARSIADLGRASAERVAALQLGRFKTPPRRFTFSIPREGALVPELGGGYQLRSRCLQEDDGSQATVPIQITSLKALPGHFEIEAQEMRFENLDDFDPNVRTIIIDGNRTNVNVRDAHDQLYPAPVSGNIVNIYVESGVTVSSLASTIAALDTGEWPAGVELNLYVYGTLLGAGGPGGYGGNPAGVGTSGGTALRVQAPLNLYRKTGSLFAGGGGGGGGGGNSSHPQSGGGGGGGAGTVPGSGASGFHENGTSGTATTGGIGGDNDGSNGLRAGNGGARGVAGQRGGENSASGKAGGAAGKSIDGIAFVTTLESLGTLIGPTA